MITQTEKLFNDLQKQIISAIENDYCEQDEIINQVLEQIEDRHVDLFDVVCELNYLVCNGTLEEYYYDGKYYVLAEE